MKLCTLRASTAAKLYSFQELERFNCKHKKRKRRNYTDGQPQSVYSKLYNSTTSKKGATDTRKRNSPPNSTFFMKLPDDPCQAACGSHKPYILLPPEHFSLIRGLIYQMESWIISKQRLQMKLYTLTKAQPLNLLKFLQLLKSQTQEQKLHRQVSTLLHLLKTNPHLLT
jgi:hypothetical protein